MPLSRPHEEVMRDYIALLERDLREYFDSRVMTRMVEGGVTHRQACERVRHSHPVKRRKRRIRKAQADLERYLTGVAYWKEREEASSTPVEQ